LELGRYLVQELRIEARGDTLGHWMAHHLAHIIDAAENERTTIPKAQARKEAIEIILKIWAHRSQLPGNANPLAPYNEILNVLSSMRPNANVWAVHRLGRKQKLISELHRILPRLIMGLLTLQLLEKTRNKKGRSKVATKRLSAEEKSLLKEFDGWVTFLEANSRSAHRKGVEKGNEKDSLQRIRSLVLSWVDNTTSTLQSIRSELTAVQPSTERTTEVSDLTK